MDRSVELPERCVVCNEAASSRISRKLYWSPTWWRAASGLSPFVLLAAGFYGGQFWLLAYFWPLVLVLIIVHLVLRQAFKVRLGACTRHRTLRRLLIASSLGAMAIMVLGVLFITGSAWATFALAGGAVLTALLAVFQSYVGIQAIRTVRLTKERAWLAGTGTPFRESLPEIQA